MKLINKEQKDGLEKRMSDGKNRQVHTKRKSNKLKKCVTFCVGFCLPA